MDDLNQLDELMACRLDDGRKAVTPCTIVIFGASGDLTIRKLIPALYHLFCEKALPSPVRIVGFARREKDDAAWREELKAGVAQFSRSKQVDEAVWTEFAANVSYCQGDLTDPAAYKRLTERLVSFAVPELRNNLLFYLAISRASSARWWSNFATRTCSSATRRPANGSAWSWKSPSAPTSPARSSSTTN